MNGVGANDTKWMMVVSNQSSGASSSRKFIPVHETIIRGAVDRVGLLLIRGTFIKKGAEKWKLSAAGIWKYTEF